MKIRLDPGTHVLSLGHVTGFGHSRSIFCHCVSARSRVRSAPCTLVHVCFVVLHAVRVSIAACIYVISCAVWHAACIFIGCVLSCCQHHVVNTCFLCEHVAYEFSH